MYANDDHVKHPSRRLHRLILILGLVVALLATACGDDKSDSDSAEPAGDETAASEDTSGGDEATGDDVADDDGAADDTGADSDASGDDAGTDDGDASGDDAGTDDGDVEAPPVSCPPEGDPSWSTAARTNGTFPFPAGSDPTMLAGAAVGGHSDFDRFVLTFTPETVDLSYSVSVWAGTPAGPQSGVEVDIDGSAFLAVEVLGSATWLRDPSDPYVGPSEIDGPGAGADNLVEAVLSEEFEGYMTWHLGYDTINPFNVFVLESPTRLVVDMCTGAAAAPASGTQAVAAGCTSSAGAVPADAVYGPARRADLDGVPGQELAYTYYVPSEGEWVLRVDAMDGSFQSQWPIPGSSGAFASEVQRIVDVNSDGVAEIMVSYSGGAYTRQIGFAVVQDCEVEPTRNLEGGVFSWDVGASVANIGHFTCLGDSVRFEAGSISDSDSPVWQMQTYRNVLTGSVWEPMGTAGSAYAYESEDSVPPVDGSADCPSAPSTVVELG